MRFHHGISRAVVILLIISLSSCAPGLPPEAATATSAPVDQPSEKEFEDFDPNNFDDPTTIDNKWIHLKPGTQFIYEGESIENGEMFPHKIVITVTDLTKVIGGVRSVATWDRDYSNDELVEAELAFFAQDNDGNVWRMGEYPEEYENGEFVKAPTWMHGLQDARAGIAMQAAPQLNTPSYSEGWGPAVDWTDRGQVDQMSSEDLCPCKMLRGCSCDQRDQQVGGGCFPT